MLRQLWCPQFVIGFGLGLIVAGIFWFIIILTAEAADMPTPGMIECESQKPRSAREYWSWREITGRKCWYQGHPGKPKTQLFWPAVHEEPAPAPTRPTIKLLKIRPVNQPPKVEPETEQREPESEQKPELPAPGSFEDRWEPVPKCGPKVCDSRLPQ